jgi:hypothetical protein
MFVVAFLCINALSRFRKHEFDTTTDIFFITIFFTDIDLVEQRRNLFLIITAKNAKMDLGKYTAWLVILVFLFRKGVESGNVVSPVLIRLWEFLPIRHTNDIFK